MRRLSPATGNVPPDHNAALLKLPGPVNVLLTAIALCANVIKAIVPSTPIQCFACFIYLSASTNPARPESPAQLHADDPLDVIWVARHPSGLCHRAHVVDPDCGCALGIGGSSAIHCHRRKQ